MTHKVYCRVRNGNWVEDNFGVTLSSNCSINPSSLGAKHFPIDRPQTQIPQSENSEKFIDTREFMRSSSTERIAAIQEIRTKTKDGLSYNLVFQHGNMQPREVILLSVCHFLLFKYKCLGKIFKHIIPIEF